MHIIIGIIGIIILLSVVIAIGKEAILSLLGSLFIAGVCYGILSIFSDNVATYGAIMGFIGGLFFMISQSDK